MADLTISPGDIPTAAQWNTYFTHTGGAWNSWTPVLTQGVSVTTTITEALYFRAGRLIMFSFSLGITSTGTATSNLAITLPVATANAGFVPLCHGVLFDTSAGLDYPFMGRQATSTTFTCKSYAATGNLGSTTFTAAVATGDTLVGSGWFVAASG